jgi:hypothetical protein
LGKYDGGAGRGFHFYSKEVRVGLVLR